MIIKRFVARKKRKNKTLILIIIIIVVYLISKKVITNANFNNEKFIDYFINDALGMYGIKNNENNEIKDINASVVFKNEIDDIDDIEIKDDKPLVYIYNTHNTEKYQNDYLDVYNIKSDVILAAKILKEYLIDEGINTIVETEDVQKELNHLGLSYGYSYDISRKNLELAAKNNDSLKYFIDLHRDSSKYENTTITIDDEKYVRLLFVVGLENKNYEPNLKLANNLSERMKKIDKNFIRGIMKKSGEGVNGIYNQDFSPNVMLVEVGGQYNNIREVDNTLKVFSKVLASYIKEKENE